MPKTVPTAVESLQNIDTNTENEVKSKSSTVPSVSGSAEAANKEGPTACLLSPETVPNTGSDTSEDTFQTANELSATCSSAEVAKESSRSSMLVNLDVAEVNHTSEAVACKHDQNEVTRTQSSYGKSTVPSVCLSVCSRL